MVNWLDRAQSSSFGRSPALTDAKSGTYYRWRVILADGVPLEVCCLPELTAAEMCELYPGTTLAPLPRDLSE
jgi:hypothetical protein